jgi:hypothetical protein
MDRLINLLRGAHCKSTHHFFAIDGLLEAQSDKGQALARILLKHHKPYLKGAKDPDQVFKDFENHVLHVRDGYWGGATRTAQRWYGKSIEFLRRNDWSEAAYAIGVLSHYFTDPFMPLHTGQSDRESIVHRPMEWSIRCAYQEILELATSDPSLTLHEIPDDPNWLAQSIRQGAWQANQHYEALIDHYDLVDSGRQPAMALVRTSKRILAQVFAWVLSGWGNVIDRMAAESRVAFPQASLTLATLVAEITSPIQKILKNIDSSRDRAEVAAMLDEYQRTGTVQDCLPQEQKSVRRARLRDPALISQPSHPRADIPAPYPLTQNLVPDPVPATKDEDHSQQTIPFTTEAAPPAPQVPPEPQVPPAPQVPPLSRVPPELQLALASPALPAKASRDEPADETDVTEDACRLTLDSAIVDAPSIGPKTASRLQAVGCHCVRDLLRADSYALSAELATGWITPAIITAWKSQAVLMCGVPRLTAAAAILMVEAQVDTVEKLAAIDLASLLELCRQAARTNVGQRALRDQPLPNAQRWQSWIQGAQDAANPRKSA